MRKLLKRWYVWLGLVLLLGLAGSVALICSGRGRITQANLDRIRLGMTRQQVIEVLGETDGQLIKDSGWYTWRNGPNRIDVDFNGDEVTGKAIYFAGALETLHWYGKKGAAKIGVKWP